MNAAEMRAYEQGHRDACRDETCILKPDSTFPTYGQGYQDGMAAEICGQGGNYGAFMEPIACGYPKHHEGPHAWATLPTFVNGVPVLNGGNE